METMSPWSKIAMLLVVVILVMPVLAACDDDDDSEAEVLNLAATPLTATDLPFVDDPVKIAVLMDWSGPQATAGWIADGVITFAEWYWNQQQGGIEVGDVRRPIELVKYDTKSQIALANGMAKKALLEGCMSICWGGVTNEMAFPVADVADPEGVLHSGFNNAKALFDDYTHFVNSFFDQDLRNDLCAGLVIDKLKPETVGFFGYDLASNRDTISLVEAKLKALDPEIEVVYKEFYDPALQDFSPYLTKIRYKNPDVLICCSTKAGWTNMANTMPGLGGWGDITVVSQDEQADLDGMEEMPGCDGWYFPMMWMADSGTPGARAFGEAWAEKCQSDSDWCKKYSPYGSIPMPTHPLMYNPILTVIKAIEMAGTDDREKVAEAVLSGDLEYDSPLGILHIDETGKSNLSGFFVQIQDGRRVVVDLD